MSQELDLEAIAKAMMGGGQNSRKEYNNKKKMKKNGYKKDKVSYIGAPYNFIPFTKRVFQYSEKDKIAHNDISDELMTGEINYRVHTNTPVIVDDGTGHFHKNPNGKFSIPGSTMRGLIRNNVQILGLSSLYEDIDDYDLMYRNIANGVEKKRYAEILGSKQIDLGNGVKIGALLNVKAGYLIYENGKYTIYQTCIDSIQKEYNNMNYYVLSERTIVNIYNTAKQNKTSFPYSFFEKNGKSRMQHEFEDFKRKENDNKPVQYIGTVNKYYRPYYEKISYQIAGQKNVVAVGKPGDYKMDGYIISTGKMQQKKAVYIIPAIDKTKPSFEIPEQDIISFKIDMEKKKNTLKQFGGREFFDLPNEGVLKPVFYIYLGGRLYFGFTPRLRLYYDHSVKEGLHNAHKEDIFDYCKSIFGYSTKNDSYRSKVSFTDAVIEKDVQEMEQVKYVLSEPKPSSYLDYLKQDKDNSTTYNKDSFELRGIKQYWLHEKTETDKQATDVKQEKVASKFCPLNSGIYFTGKVRFKNLTKAELGLLLWSMQLEENSCMNVGKAKAFGYGNISLSIKNIKCINKKKAYKSEELNLDPFDIIKSQPLIQEYKEKVNKFLNGKKIDELPEIRDFFAMKDSTKIPKPDNIRYMDINKKEYQSRKKPLLSIQNIIKE